MVTIGGLFVYGSSRLVGGLINALYEPQLEDMLQKTGQWEDFQAGKCPCAGCQTPVTVDNLGLMLESQNGFQFICRNSLCIMSYYDRLEELEIHGGTGNESLSIVETT